MYLEKLKSILRVPQATCSKGDNFRWVKLEKEYGFNFPSDYKDFINTYGTGSVNDFIWILTPFESSEHINIFSRAEVMRNSYNYLKESYPDDFKYSIYPDKKGLLPWAFADNGDELYFDIENNRTICNAFKMSRF